MPLNIFINNSSNGILFPELLNANNCRVGAINPAISIIGITHHFKIAPPMSIMVMFIAASIAIIEMSDIPIAVLKLLSMPFV